jgi:WD40 repeat protein
VITGANEEIKSWRIAADPGYTKLPATDHVEEAAFHPADAALLVTASRDGTLRMWDVVKNQIVFSIRLDGPITAMTFSTDAKRVAVAGSKRISIVDLAQRKVVASYDGQAAGGTIRAVRNLVFNPDGSKVLSIRSSLALGGDAHLWDAATGQVIWAKDLMTPPTKDFFSPEPTRKGLLPSSARFAPDGSTVEIAGTVVLSLLNTILVIDATSGEVMRQMEGPSRVITAPSGKVFATVEPRDGNRTIVIRHAGTPGKRIELTGIPRLVSSAAFNHDASRIAVACDNQYGNERGDLRIWDAGAGRELLHIQGIATDIRRLSFSADGHRLAVLCADGSVRVYDGSPAGGANEKKN